MKTFVICIGIVALIGAALLWVCAWAVGEMEKEEQELLRIQLEDDRTTCGLIEED